MCLFQQEAHELSKEQDFSSGKETQGQITHWKIFLKFALTQST